MSAAPAGVGSRFGGGVTAAFKKGGGGGKEKQGRVAMGGGESDGDVSDFQRPSKKMKAVGRCRSL